MTEKKTRMSKWKIGLATLAIGALMVVPVGAEDINDTTQADLEIASGDFDVTLENASLDPITEYALGMETTGDVDVTVEDYRGGDGNWTVDLTASDFQIGEEGATISNENFLVTGSSPVDDQGGDGTVTPFSGEDASLDAQVQVGEGNDAHGTFQWSPDLLVDVPNGAEAGEYSSTMTLTSNVAPEPEQ